MSGLRVVLFGEVTIERDGRAVPCPANKATELLCYLLVHRDRAHSRERLCDVLWPGEPGPVSRRYLRQALWRLNTAMTGPDGACEAVVCTGSGWLRANPDAVEWLDVGTFDDAEAATRDTDGAALSAAQAATLEDAVGLHRADLLAAWYQDWCDAERGRLQLAHIAMREQLMAYYEARRQYTHGVHHGLAVLRHDPARETAHRLLMRLRYGAGDRTGAIRQFQACVAALDADLGIAPSAATTALHQQIRADRVSEPPVRLVPPLGPLDAADRPEPRTGEPGWLDLLADRLEEIQASLTALQHVIARAGSPDLERAVTVDAW